EAGTQRAVDQATGQDRVLGGTTLASEEAAGDLARGVGLLFDVDRQREEVGTLTGFLGTVRSRKDAGLTECGDDRTLGLRGEKARRKGDGLVGARDGARYGYGFSHGVLLGAQRSVEAAPRWPAPSRRSPGWTERSSTDN